MYVFLYYITMLQKLNMSGAFYLLIYKADQLPHKAQLRFHHQIYISNYRKPYVHTIFKEVLQREQRSPTSFAI